jgi:hypothetical protein
MSKLHKADDTKTRSTAHSPRLYRTFVFHCSWIGTEACLCAVFPSYFCGRRGQRIFSREWFCHLKQRLAENRVVALTTRRGLAFFSVEALPIICWASLRFKQPLMSSLLINANITNISENMNVGISLPDYRRAIVLNNIAVSFLEREAYAQAMETLKDAICIMKQALCAGQLLESASSDCNVEKVNKAFRLLLATNHERSAASGADVKSPVDTIIFDKGPMQISAASPFLCADSPYQVISPIRIEIIDSECLLDRDSDLDSALMLYNYALAHVAMAESSCLKKKHRLGALALFDMATTVIMNGDGGLCYRGPGDHHHHGEEDIFNENRLVISFIITSNRVRVLMDLGDYLAAKEMMGHLGLLGEAVMEVMSAESELPIPYPAAAA